MIPRPSWLKELSFSGLSAEERAQATLMELEGARQLHRTQSLLSAPNWVEVTPSLKLCEIDFIDLLGVLRAV